MIRWKTPPQGKSGEAVLLDPQGKEQWIRYQRDDQGLWLETAEGFFGFDVRRTTSDEGLSEYTLLRRLHVEVRSGLQNQSVFDLPGASGGKVKKSLKIKSQMPGKIVRLLVQPRAVVKKGERLMVMEAMKMENEIKSPVDGVIKSIQVTEGQAVETGAELVTFE